MKRTKRYVSLVLLLAVCIMLVCNGCSVADIFHADQKIAIEEIKDSVVMIETFDADNEPLAQGSGFSAYKSNWIITNMHVIEGARYITVITDEGEKLPVEEIVLYNKKDDLAILQVDGELEPLTLGNASGLRIKDKITAIGSPRGERNTVSEGIISNLDVENEIRITAPISHGSSGGVLLNEDYEVIGITNAGYDDAQNLNFAIDVSLLEDMYKCYTSQTYDVINLENVLLFLPYIENPCGKNVLEIPEKITTAKGYNYAVDSLEIFYQATNKYEIFAWSIRMLAELEEVCGGNYTHYNRFLKQNKTEQRTATDYYEDFLGFETDEVEQGLGATTPAEIKTWGIAEYILRLNLLSVYELAIFMAEIDEPTISQDAIIDCMNEMQMSYETKIIINRLLYITDDTYNSDILEYYNGNEGITYDQEVALLEYLGMNVEADGTVWW